MGMIILTSLHIILNFVIVVSSMVGDLISSYIFFSSEAGEGETEHGCSAGPATLIITTHRGPQESGGMNRVRKQRICLLCRDVGT